MLGRGGPSEAWRGAAWRGMACVLFCPLVSKLGEMKEQFLAVSKILHKNLGSFGHQSSDQNRIFSRAVTTT